MNKFTITLFIVVVALTLVGVATSTPVLNEIATALAIIDAVVFAIGEDKKLKQNKEE